MFGYLQGESPKNPLSVSLLENHPPQTWEVARSHYFLPPRRKNAYCPALHLYRNLRLFQHHIYDEIYAFSVYYFLYYLLVGVIYEFSLPLFHSHCKFHQNLTHFINLRNYCGKTMREARKDIPSLFFNYGFRNWFWFGIFFVIKIILNTVSPGIMLNVHDRGISFPIYVVMTRELYF